MAATNESLNCSWLIWMCSGITPVPYGDLEFLCEKASPWWGPASGDKTHIMCFSGQSRARWQYLHKLLKNAIFFISLISISNLLIYRCSVLWQWTWYRLCDVGHWKGLAAKVYSNYTVGRIKEISHLAFSSVSSYHPAYRPWKHKSGLVSQNSTALYMDKSWCVKILMLLCQ